MEKALIEWVQPWLFGRGFVGDFPHYRRPQKERIDLLSFLFNEFLPNFSIDVAVCNPSGIVQQHIRVRPEDVCAWDTPLEHRSKIGPSRKRYGRVFTYPRIFWNVFLDRFGRIAADVIGYLESDAEAFWVNAAVPPAIVEPELHSHHPAVDSSPARSDSAGINAMLKYSPDMPWEEQFEILKTFIEDWHGPISEEDGIPESELNGLPLPPPAERLYRLCGRITDRLGKQDNLHSPASEYWKLKYANHCVVLFSECQCSSDWIVRLDEENPRVYISDGLLYRLENERLCGFLLQWCYYNAILGAACSRTGGGNLDDILPLWKPVPLAPMESSHNILLRFYYSDSALGVVYKSEYLSGYFHCAAKSEEDLAFMKHLFNEQWEDYATHEPLGPEYSRGQI